MEYRTIQSLTVHSKEGEKTIPIGAVVILNEEQVTRLVGAGKVVLIKPEVKTLTDYQAMFEEAVAEVGTRYLPGTLEMIREDFPDLTGEIDQAEDKINELWLSVRTKVVDLGAFREAVDKWKHLHLKAIAIFSLKKKAGMSLTFKPGLTIYGRDGGL